MNITKKQIRKIIEKVVNEDNGAPQLPGGTPVSNAFNELASALQDLDRLDRSMVIYDLVDQLMEMTK